ncbi:MAG: hypothetical protein L0287_20180, partial [Anaerolineae bacterium]|nr:hypothetical protein [Anaerolineae bacterium]
LMESGYDIIKRIFDQMIDSGELNGIPFGFYRPASGFRPEKISIAPGILHPVNNPRDDVAFPTLPQGMQAFGHNIITLVSQILDQTTKIGSLQLGSVPASRSAALRTTANMQAILQQGDSRPERVLRRFFGGLAEAWAQFHELNQVYLPKNKMYRIMHGAAENLNPYQQINDPAAIRGRFYFDFTASILNTNKAMAQQAHQQMLGTLIHPLMLQTGIVTPEKMYNLTRDWIKGLQQDHTKYIQAPPGVNPWDGPALTVSDAIQLIMNGVYPVGPTVEPLDVHIQQLQEFVTSQEMDRYFTPQQARMLGQYAAKRVAEYQARIQQQMLMQLAGQFNQDRKGGAPTSPGQPGNPPTMGPGGNASVQGQELLNESLPGAGGGGNAQAS